MDRSFPSGPAFAALLAVFLLAPAGCSRQAARDEGLPPPSDDEVIRCFPEWGSVAFNVNGVPVPDATVDRFAAFYKAMGTQNDDKAKARAIEEAILPTAAVYAEYRDRGRLEEWSQRVRDVAARLAKGEDFAEVARSCSNCPTKSAGGNLGAPFSREQNLAPLTEAGFRTQAGHETGPVVSVVGAHFLRIHKVIDGSSAARDQREGAHILVAFDPKDVEDSATLRDLLQKLKKEARVEKVKDPYKKLIPTAYRR